MKKIISVLATVLTIIICSTALTACGSVYEVYFPIGDSRVENDNVTCHYEIAETLKDGYELKGYFTAESEANLDDEFVLSISFDNLYSDSFSEKVIFSFKGDQLKNAAGGKLEFVVKFDKLSDIFPETAEPKAFAFHFHRASADRGDMTKWNESSYTYTFDGSKLSLEK